MKIVSPLGWRPRLRGQVAISAAMTATQGALGFAAIPLGTLVLGPADYGHYALVLSFMAPAVAVAEAGAGLLLAEAWANSALAARADILVSLLALSGVIAAVAAVLIAVLLPAAAAWLGLAVAITPLQVALVAMALPFAAWNSVLRTALVLDGRAWLQAVAAAVQTGVVLIALALLLFVAQLGGVALFGAYLAGTVASYLLMAFALRALRHGRVRRQWLGEGRRNFGPSTVVSTLDHARAILESVSIVRVFGAGTLGLLSHARLYQGLLLQGTNALAQPIWPVALAEARKPGSDFINIRRAWDVVHLGLACIGIVAAIWGAAFLHWFTHGKFTAAAPLLPTMAALVLLQTSGRPAIAACYALGAARQAMWARAAALLCGAAVLLAGVIAGDFAIVVAALLLDGVVYRVLLHVIARRQRPVPFQDQVALAGLVAIAGAWFVAQTAGAPAALLFCALPLAFAWPSLLHSAGLARSLLAGAGTR